MARETDASRGPSTVRQHGEAAESSPTGNAYFHISCVRLLVYGMEAPWCLRPIAMENRLASFSEYHREIIGDSIFR